jgi:hypothetical protein
MKPDDLVRSNAPKRVFAKVVSIKDGKVVLNFGWDAPRARFWSCTEEHLNKHYRKA